MKNILNKIFITLMIWITLTFFCATPISQAKKLKIGEGQYYYTGTQEAEVVITDSMWEMVLNALSEIVNYLFGAMLLGVRGVVVGWVEIFEILLTSILTLDDSLGNIVEGAMKSYSSYVINVEDIIFNEVPLLDANIFNEIEEDSEEEDATEENEDNQDAEADK